MKKKREKSRAFFSGGMRGWGGARGLLRTNIKKWGCEKKKKEAKLNKPKCVRINPRAPLSLKIAPPSNGKPDFCSFFEVTY